MATTVAVAAGVQGTTGLGFALVVAPVLAFLQPQLVPVLLLFLMLPLNVFTLLRERRALDWKGGGWMTLGRAFGVPAGAAVLAAMSPHALNLLIAAVTMAAALATVIAPTFRPNHSALVTVGVITGISETATGISGPPMALAYQHHSPEVLRSTLAGCFLVGEMMSIGALAWAGRTTSQQVLYAALLLPFLALGFLASSFIRHHVNGKLLRGLVLVFAVTSAVVLVIRG